MEKISRVVFFIFILLLPTQLGKHFWPEWSLVDGVRVDYLSPTIYLTDIVLVVLLVSYFLKGISNIKYQISNIQIKNQKFKRTIFILLALFLLIGFWVLKAEKKWLGGYWLGRYLEIPLVAFLTSEAGRIRGARGNRWTGREMPMALAIAILFSVGLGITQMGLGRTTGWLWWLGERSFNLATPGIATMTIWGREILRPYATFGHPNALGGFLAAAIMILSGKKEKGKRKKEMLEQLEKALIFIGVLGVILTGSRGAVAALIAAALLPQVKSEKLKVKGLLIILGILGGVGILGWLGRSGGSGVSGAERQILAGAAVDMWRQNWLTGVGAGQFLVELPKYLPAGFYKIQPVHNVFLLGLAEFGAAGVIMGLIGLMSLMRQMWRTDSLRIWLAVLVVILVTGMVDHYWLTAQQNRLLLGVILGMMVRKKNN